MTYRTRSNARAWHAVTFAIALFAVLNSETDPDVQAGRPT
jgi:hypothetical protein